jgi:hypothetical protein
VLRTITHVHIQQPGCDSETFRHVQAFGCRPPHGGCHADVHTSSRGVILIGESSSSTNSADPDSYMALPNGQNIMLWLGDGNVLCCAG